MCTWDTAPRKARTLTVWSTAFTVDDMQKKEGNADFVSISVDGRNGWKFHRASDSNNEKCDLVFPATAGSYQLSFYNNDPGDSNSPCDSVMAAAQVIVPLFPR